MRQTEPNPKLERVRYELRSTGVKADEQNRLRSGIHSRGYLPHVKREGASYFVTFRLADSLPKEVFVKFMAERAERLRQLEKDRTRLAGKPGAIKDTEESIDLDYKRKVERYLDTGCGDCVLRRSELAGLIAETFRFFENQRYRLDAWVVMPNHVHAVLWPMPGFMVGKIVKTWKQYTAVRANRILERVGTSFWQPESFDHWIRDDQEHARCGGYVIRNPVVAGLCKTPEDWKWSSAWSGWRT